MAAIFELLVTRLSESVYTISAVLLDAENVSIAFGIALLSCIEVRYKYFRFSGRHFEFIVSGYFN